MNILRTIVNNLLYYIFLFVPDSLLYFFISIAAYLRSLYRIVVHFNMAVELYEGYRKGCLVKILWIGTEEWKDYILEILYDSRYEVKKLEHTNLINLQKTIDNLPRNCDLIYIEQNSLLPVIKGLKKIEQALNTIMRANELRDIHSPNSTKSKRRIYTRKIKLIEKNRIEFREFKVSKHIAQLRLFYEQLYAPYISHRWGKNSVESFDAMRIFYSKGILRLAYLDGEAIAGTLFLHSHDTLISCKYGVRDPNNKVHRAACSIHSYLKYAEDNNITYFSAFSVKPFFNDGVFHYKRDCGLSVQIDKRNYYYDKKLYLKVMNYSLGTVNFLIEEPFIFVRNGNLVANLMCSGGSPNLVDEIIDQYQRYRTGGIKQYEFYVPRELTEQEKHQIYQRCGISKAENVFTFIN